MISQLIDLVVVDDSNALSEVIRAEWLAENLLEGAAIYTEL